LQFFLTGKTQDVTPLVRDFIARDESVKNSSHNTANTNVIWHHNKLLALNEGGQPVSLDTNDLRQCQLYTFAKTWEGPRCYLV